jgi:hypothetical protein
VPGGACAGVVQYSISIRRGPRGLCRCVIIFEYYYRTHILKRERSIAFQPDNNDIAHMYPPPHTHMTHMYPPPHSIR